MKKEFIVERQGKTFVLYAGLLDEAHSRGLRSIRTELLQVPNETNGQTAIVFATVETELGTFTGLGDAAPYNVSPQMQTCLIRMAETRAKARALRDAVNVAAVALEELPPEETELPELTEDRPLPLRLPTGENGGAKATPAQLKAIYSIARNEHRLSEEETDARVRSHFGRAPTELTKRQASEAIDRLKAGNF
ncbi:MAG: hypothetical protein KatS3mg061_2102 [Dehalococcoidia bacterium]|nr:MAG: hypothetical protein KatS3mg061_2102 [Dehalococcoidia bacterium]